MCISNIINRLFKNKEYTFYLNKKDFTQSYFVYYVDDRKKIYYIYELKQRKNIKDVQYDKQRNIITIDTIHDDRWIFDMNIEKNDLECFLMEILSSHPLNFG